MKKSVTSVLIFASVVLAACGSAAPSTSPSAGSSAASAAKPAASSGSASSAKPAASSSSVTSAAASAKPAASGSSAAGATAKPAASASGGASGQLTKLTVSYSALIGTELPLWMADAAGIFKKNGLDVKVVSISSSQGIPAVISGQTQIADLGGSEALSATAGGADLVTVAVDSPVYPFVLQVPASIKTVNDLKGKKIGVSNFGSASDIATRVALRKEGLDPDKDVTILAVGSASNRIAAMSSGNLQGGMSFPPETLKLEQQGFHTLIDLAALKAPATIASSVVKRSYVDANRPVIQKYVDSLVEAIAYERKNKQATVDVLKKYYKSDDDKAMGVAYDFFVSSVIPSLPYPKPDQYADAQQILGAKNEAVKNYDVPKMLDESFVKSAADRGLDKQ